MRNRHIVTKPTEIKKGRQSDKDEYFSYPRGRYHDGKMGKATYRILGIIVSYSVILFHKKKITL
jgi:hypothetical protein